MKLLFIRPPFAIEKFYFPHFINESLAIESLSAFLKPTSHQVEIIDSVAEAWNKYWQDKKYPETIFQGLKKNQILNKIKKIRPDAVGITWLFSTQNPSVDLTLKTIKKYSQDLPIIVGGPHPSATPEIIMADYPEIDITVYGEGEITLKELLDKEMKDLESIKGIAFRKDNKIIINQPRSLITDLNILPLPERNKKLTLNYSRQYVTRAFYYRLKKFNITNKKLLGFLAALPGLDKITYSLHNKRNRKFLPEADVVTSRGCPNRCTFCAIHNIWGHCWRRYSAEYVLAEIDELVRKFGIKHINIQDDNFNVSKQRTIEICRGIVENKYNISLLAPAGAFVPTLDEEVLTWLKKAGLSELRMSIESGNQEILYNVIKKRIDLTQVKKVVDICKKLGIYTEGAFMFGVPGETLKTMQDSLDFARDTGFDRIVKFIFQPFPNTELYNLAQEKGYLTPDYNPKKIYITGNKCYIKTDQFSPEDVLRMIGR